MQNLPADLRPSALRRHRRPGDRPRPPAARNRSHPAGILYHSRPIGDNIGLPKREADPEEIIASVEARPAPRRRVEVQARLRHHGRRARRHPLGRPETASRDRPLPDPRVSRPDLRRLPPPSTRRPTARSAGTQDLAHSKTTSSSRPRLVPHGLRQDPVLDAGRRRRSPRPRSSRTARASSAACTTCSPPGDRSGKGGMNEQRQRDPTQAGTPQEQRVRQRRSAAQFRHLRSRGEPAEALRQRLEGILPARQALQKTLHHPHDLHGAARDFRQSLAPHGAVFRRLLHRARDHGRTRGLRHRVRLARALTGRRGPRLHARRGPDRNGHRLRDPRKGLSETAEPRLRLLRPHRGRLDPRPPHQRRDERHRGHRLVAHRPRLGREYRPLNPRGDVLAQLETHVARPPRPAPDGVHRQVLQEPHPEAHARGQRANSAITAAQRRHHGRPHRQDPEPCRAHAGGIQPPHRPLCGSLHGLGTASAFRFNP